MKRMAQPTLERGRILMSPIADLNWVDFQGPHPSVTWEFETTEKP